MLLSCQKYSHCLAVFVLLTTCGVMSDVELSIEEANILAEFFVATQYHNSTAVTPANACTSWLNLVTCTNKSDGRDGSTISSLYFNRQSLTGTIPRSISNLTQLHTFVVSDNILYGTLPPELSNWNASLKMFDVSSNRITGTLPALYSSWTMLTLFNVSYNLITGTLPRSYSSWSGLHSFLASFNDQLDGPIPNEWAREWRQIASFQVASNSLTGTIPDFFSNSTTLLTFDVSLNFLTGAFPSEFHRNSPLQLMSVHHNSLSGTLPAKIAPMLTALSYFSVATNYFTGTLPLEYAQWGRTIVNFDVGGNQLTGTLPPEYSNWTSLNDFRTTSNQFYGTLPAAYAAWGLSLLRFNVRNNTLTGPIPSVYALWSRVESFDVGINSLSGSLPSNFSQWGSTIDRISVFSNRLHDSIPESWGSSMITLTRLLAGQNNFSSSLKAGSFPNIVVLSVSFNNISGVLPGLHSWPQLRFLDAQNNSLLTGSIMALSFVVSSICSTELCATTNIPNFARYACFPKDVSADDIGSDPSEVLSFATRYPFSPFLCSSTTTMAPSATPGQPSTLSPNSTAEVRAGAVVGPLESTSVAVGIVTSTVALVSTLGAVDAADAQMLVSILGSPCVCITRSPTQKREGSVLLIALSPFSSLGSAWAAIGNSLLCGVLVGLHIFCLRLMSSTRSDASLRSSNGPRNIMNRTLLGRWIAERGSVHCGDRRTLLARLRFPNLSVTFLLLLVPGIVHSVVDVSNQLASSLVDDPTGDDNQTSVSQELHASALAVGVVCITAAVFFAEIVAYRHVEYEVSSLSSAPSKRGRRHFLRFAFHENPTRVFAPFPRSLSTVVFP
ncbi:GP46-like surface antigen, putative, partial [Bodo saltans]